MAKIMKADGTVEMIKPAGKKFTLEEMQKVVGGLIEAVPNTRHRVWCNEEGILLGLPTNHQASLTYGMRLRGDVLVLEPGDKM